MARKTSGDSTKRVSHDIFCGIHTSFTTQGPGPGTTRPAPRLQPKPPQRVRLFYRSDPMPYALFCNEARLSKTYPTEADVWKLARLSGLVIDAESRRGRPAPRPLLDNDYEIKPCRPDPQEDPAKNQAEAESLAQRELQFMS